MRRWVPRFYSLRNFSSCPLYYRYGSQKIRSASAETLPAGCDTLYVVGGLYGNTFALDAIKARAAKEKAHLCFNGDFNFLNADPEMWEKVNHEILIANKFQAIAGNVDYEMVARTSIGCGCSYPEYTSAGVIQRSDQIVGKLREISEASKREDIKKALRELPLFRVYSIAGRRVAVIHGDPDSLAGWGLAPETTEPVDPLLQANLGVSRNHPCTTVKQLRQWLLDANVDSFASTHTCIPFAQSVRDDGGKVVGVYFNNGAAGMGCFRRTTAGLLTRISTSRAVPEDSLYGTELNGVRYDAVPLEYDTRAWQHAFERLWGPTGLAEISYGNRIRNGLNFFTVAMANRL